LRTKVAQALVLVFAFAAAAQQPQKMHRVGFIASTSPVSELITVNPAARAFARGMRELGYIEGRNLVIEWRSAEGNFERFPEIVRELVAIKVDVIVTVTNPMTKAAKDVTRTVPIVMAASTNPVEQGLVQSFARPGGNVTGVTLDAGPEIVGKRLQLLKELFPAISRVILLGAKLEGVDERGAEVAGQAVGIKLMFVEPDPAQQYAGAFAHIARERPDALVVAATAPNYAYRRQIAQFAATSRLPVMYPTRDYIDAGGLVAYGVDISELFRRPAAGYVDRILKGAKPADLPVERPTKFELAINLKTARALGVTIPQAVLVRADHVIQ
jgi:putative ABC transport system substrate-binding protein